MTWSFSLICRGEDLEKILLSNYALDHREIFAQKSSSNLSESKSPIHQYPFQLTLFWKVPPLTFMFPLQFVQSTFRNVFSDEFLFSKEGLPDEFSSDELLVVCCRLYSASPFGFTSVSRACL